MTSAPALGSPTRMPARALSGRGATPGARRASPQVYRRRRVAVLGSALFLLLLTWLSVVGLLGTGSPGATRALGPAREMSARSWVVRPGDTLWSIALASGAGGDIRPLVDRLSAEVHGQPLQPGEVIALP